MSSARIALLGAGYTLERVAAHFAPEEVILTTTTIEKIAHYRKAGFIAEELDITRAQDVRDFFVRHSSLEVVVDSIPPVQSTVLSTTGGVANIVRSVRSSGPAVRRIIYLSTTGVYGVEDGSWVDEDHELTPRSKRGSDRADCEGIYLSNFSDVSCYRIAAIYGPGRGIGISLRAGKYPYIEPGDRWSNRIHVDDLARAIVEGIRYDGKLPIAINLSDDKPSLTSEVVSWYCEKFNLPRPAPMTLEQAKERRLEMLLSNQRISNKLLRDTFQLNLRYPSYREGAGSEFGEA